MVAKGERAFVHYRGTLDDGREFDSSYRYGAPLEISYGDDEMLPGLDEALRDMQPGDTCAIRIAAEDAYGAYDQSLVETAPAEAFPNASNLPIGGFIELRTPQGTLRTKVVKIENGLVYFDHNHELAGQALNFEISLIPPEQARAELAMNRPGNHLSSWDELGKILGSRSS